MNGDFTVVTDRVATLGLPENVVNAIPLQGVQFDETGAPPTGFLEGIIPNPVDLLLQGLALIGAAIAASQRRLGHFSRGTYAQLSTLSSDIANSYLGFVRYV